MPARRRRQALAWVDYRTFASPGAAVLRVRKEARRCNHTPAPSMSHRSILKKHPSMPIHAVLVWNCATVGVALQLTSIRRATNEMGGNDGRRTAKKAEKATKDGDQQESSVKRESNRFLILDHHTFTLPVAVASACHGRWSTCCTYLQQVSPSHQPSQQRSPQFLTMSASSRHPPASPSATCRIVAGSVNRC